MTTPVYNCRKVEPFEIDADLEKPQWAGAELIELVDVVTGAPPRFPTQARLVYDETHLYASFHCVDRYIWGRFTERDAPVWEEEAVELFIDPGRTGFAYYELELSPRNVVFDLFVLNAGRAEGRPMVMLPEWDCEGWRTAVRIEGTLNAMDGKDSHWDAEMAIPFACLIGAPNTPPRPGDEWRFNAYRIERPEAEPVESSAFAPTGAFEFHVPERFGILRFR